MSTDGAKRFGSQCIVLAIDAKRPLFSGESPFWEMFIGGGANLGENRDSKTSFLPGE